MKSSEGVKIDYSFVEIALQYLHSSSEELLLQIGDHIAAKKILSNAQISDTNQNNLKEFWKEILEREKSKGEEHFHRIQSCIAYIRDNSETLLEYVDELKSYLPADFTFDCTLYLEVGYDIGIVSEGDAFLNVGHEIFHQNKRELIYFALHELHHVGYTHYNEFNINFSEIHTTAEFVKLIEKLTHLEGTATYAVKEIRERESQLSFFDYKILKNKEMRNKTVEEYLTIYDRFRYTKRVPIEERDFETLELMSGKNKRLWYITGAHMAEKIDKNLGREVLIQTIVEGPESFFARFFEIYNQASL